MTLAKQAHGHAAAYPPLLAEAWRIAQTARHGLHGRRNAGVGENFWQFRDYQGQEPASMIDWRQSARSDRLYVRERERELAQTLYLWADRSGSMHYRSAPNLPLKTERAYVLLLALANLLLRGGEKITWLSTPPLHAQGLPSFNQLATRLLPLTLAEANFPPPIPVTRHAQIVLAGDFMPDTTLWQKQLRSYAAQNPQGILLHITDPEEEAPSFKGRVRLLGCEHEPSLLLPQAEALRDAYQKRWASHKAQTRALAEGLGWRYVHHLTANPPHQALSQLITLLAAAP